MSARERPTCWCGTKDLAVFSPEYAVCSVCGTLVSCVGLGAEDIPVEDDERSFYGKGYWLRHQVKNLGKPDIHQRAAPTCPSAACTGCGHCCVTSHLPRAFSRSAVPTEASSPCCARLATMRLALS